MADVTSCCAFDLQRNRVLVLLECLYSPWPHIVPFRAFATTRNASPADSVVTQPYDKITPAIRRTVITPPVPITWCA